MWQHFYRCLLLLALAFLLGSCSLLSRLITPTLTESLSQIHAGNYQLDAEHFTLLFKVNHMGFSTFVGRFNQVRASLDYNAEDVSLSRLHAVVAMASVDVNNEKLERALRGRFWFDTERFPEAVFKTVSARKLNEDTLLFNGELTFLGVTQTLPLQVTVNGAANNVLTGKYTLGFAASTALLRSDFGLDRYVPSVGDEVVLEVHAEFQRQ